MGLYIYDRSLSEYRTLPDLQTSQAPNECPFGRKLLFYSIFWSYILYASQAVSLSTVYIVAKTMMWIFIQEPSKLRFDACIYPDYGDKS